MAQLLGRHPLDCVRLCRHCDKLRDTRYQGAWILRMPDRQIVEARIYVCRTCSDVFAADHEPRPDVSSDRLLEITDLRAWHRLREDVSMFFELEAS